MENSVLTDLPLQSEVDLFIVTYFPLLGYVLSIHCPLEFFDSVLLYQTYKRKHPIVLNNVNSDK